MRRRDREVTGLDNILAILNKCDTLRLGLCAGNRPYVVPMNFAHEVTGGTVVLYLHCAAAGRKLDILAQNRNVCFEADCSYRLVKAERPENWTAEYESVIGEGTTDILTDTAQKIHALDILMRRYGYEGTMEYSPQALAAVAVLRISVASITGKRNLPKPDMV